ncbi:hypothetical protein BpHYR1_034690 [Brachionus plicatilis]|uniref:Uncharacterized protein n=1 Tax=Brachionus plicatilis TaxID=10195 RepID=A0A3M7SHQ3_BRAPC|nr:hypothetical protein BpHYR1_034690 [Brachionus plicatilis]
MMPKLKKSNSALSDGSMDASVATIYVLVRQNLSFDIFYVLDIIHKVLLHKLYSIILENDVIFKNTLGKNNCLNRKKNLPLTIELIKDYARAFVNSSRSCKKKTPLCNIWNEFSEWGHVQNVIILITKILSKFQNFKIITI